MKTEDPINDELKKLQDLVKEVPVGMLSTTNAAGHSHARPMQTLEFDRHGALWFFTYTGGDKVHDITENNSVNLTYADPSSGLYVSVTGTAQVLKDTAKMEALWEDKFKAWIPEGPSDPHVALLKINTDDAEYWDVTSSKMIKLVKMAKAMASGERADAGDHGEISNA